MESMSRARGKVQAPDSQFVVCTDELLKIRHSSALQKKSGTTDLQTKQSACFMGKEEKKANLSGTSTELTICSIEREFDRLLI